MAVARRRRQAPATAVEEARRLVVQDGWALFTGWQLADALGVGEREAEDILRSLLAEGALWRVWWSNTLGVIDGIYSTTPNLLEAAERCKRAPTAPSSAPCRQAFRELAEVLGEPKILTLL